jgi:serine O-acetyltransferase
LLRLPSGRILGPSRRPNGATWPPSESALDPLPWAETTRRMAADTRRLAERLTARGEPRPVLMGLHPSALATRLYRLSHHLWRGGHGRLARLLWHLNLLVTGADVHPHSDIDGGLLIPHPAGASLSGKAGHDLTLGPLAGVGGELGRDEDVGAGPGLPVLGDGVSLGAHAGILGPVRIGAGAALGPGCVVTRDLPDGAVVEPADVRVVSGSSAG